MSTFGKSQLMRATFSIGYLLLLFLVHRHVTFELLSTQPLENRASPLLAWLTGALSDLWVATCLGLLLWIFSSTASLFSLLLPVKWQTVARKLGVFGFVSYHLLWLLLVIGHVAYVEYFQHQIIPSHLDYLGDGIFMGASLKSWVTLETGTGVIIAGLLLFWFLRQENQSTHPKTGSMAAIFVGLVLTSIFAHKANLHYRVQLLLEKNIQMNALEQLYYQLRKTNRIAPLTKEEIKILTDQKKDVFSPTEILTSASHSNLDQVGISLKWAFQEQLRSQEPAFVITILLESARMAEFFGPTSTLTPAFNKLRDQGIFFTNAYSTGTVTRGGQEAVWCGTIGSLNTSMMRDRPETTIPCLPKALKQSSATHVPSYWWHGGEGDFDSQLHFWRKQGVENILSQSSFKASAPKTPWGVSDLQLMEESLIHLNAVAKNQFAGFHLIMILTVTNHIPWTIPIDAPIAIKKKPQSHPSAGTIAYTDFTLGRFIESLKHDNLWQRSLIFIVGDHGNIVPPLFTEYARNRPHLNADLLTHVPMLISGGITSKALKKSQLTKHEVNRFVSQADIAPTISYLADQAELRFMGENLFVNQRRFPVISDLGNSLYLPKSKKLFNEIDVRTAPQTSEKTRKGLSFYRGIIHFLNHIADSQLQMARN